MNVAIRAWLILSAITLCLALALAVGAAAVPPVAWALLAAAASLLKARLILLDYLNLRSVRGWRAAFMAGLVALLVAVYGLLLAGN